MLLDRTRELFQVLADRDGLATAPCRQLEGPLLERYAEDCVRRGNVLEPSLSSSGDEVSCYRFSYGFPTFRSAPEPTVRTMLRLAEAIGGAAVEATRRLGTAMQRDCVEQPIVGFASDRARRQRFKLYLMFRPDTDAQARELTRHVLGSAGAPDQPGHLHMVGLDIGAAGMVGAKLYFEHASLELGADFACRPRQLRRCLAIHAVESPDDAATEPVAIDFALQDTGLTWMELEEEVARDHPAIVRALRELSGTMPLHVRRVSLFRGEPRKINLYYVLREAEPGTTSRSR